MRISKANSLVLLVLGLTVTLAFVFLGIASFRAGEGYKWLAQALPVWLATDALLIGGYFWERNKRLGVAKIQTRRERFRRNWWLLLYVVFSVAVASLTRAFFPTYYGAFYGTGYWSLLGVSLITLFWFAVSSRRETIYSRSMRWAIIAILVLAGIASGPLIVILMGAHGSVSPVVAIVGIVWITPLLLWKWRLYPFIACLSHRNSSKLDS